MKPKHSARKQFDPTDTAERNFSLALVGDALVGNAVWTKDREAIFKLVGLFENAASANKMVQELPAPALVPKHPERRPAALALRSRHAMQLLLGCKREFDKVAWPLLERALLEQDPGPFKAFAACIEAAKRLKKNGPVHPLEAEIIRITKAREALGQTRLTDTELTVELCKRIPGGIDVAQVRRARRDLGILPAPGIQGRPKKGTINGS